MFGTQDLAIFTTAGWLLNVTPGPDTFFIVSRALSQGFRAGLFAALGVGAGCLMHIALTAIGLSALLSASTIGFAAVKFGGAAYLLYLGFQMLRTRAQQRSDPSVTTIARLKHVFWQGFLTNALNPKVALFFLAFLPQFVAPDAPHKPLAMVFLGLVFDINGTLWNVGVALVATKFGRSAARSEVFAGWLNKIIGAAFIGFGIRLIATSRS